MLGWSLSIFSKWEDIYVDYVCEGLLCKIGGGSDCDDSSCTQCDGPSWDGPCWIISWEGEILESEDLW